MNEVTQPATEKEIVIQGEKFTLPIHYQEGHTLNAIEAAVLSQTWLENVRNNCAKHVKAALDEENEMTMAEARQAVEAYAAEYVFSIREASGSRAGQTPEEREARKIARDMFKILLQQKGIKYSDLNSTDEGKEKVAAAIEKIAASEKVQKAAKKRIADTAKAAEDALADIEI